MYKSIEIKRTEFSKLDFNENYANLSNDVWIRGEMKLFTYKVSSGIFINSFVAEYVLLQFIKNNDDVQKYISMSWKRIIIDEAQDLSIIRHNILISMHKKCGVKIVLIGDPKQSIYKFTGADKNIFEKINKSSLINSYEIKLTKNFRYIGGEPELVNILSSGDKNELKENLLSAIKKKCIPIINDLDQVLENIIDENETALILFKKNIDLENTINKLEIPKNKVGVYLKIDDAKIDKLTIEQVSFIENLFLYKLLIEGVILIKQLSFNPIEEIISFLWPYDESSNNKFLELFWLKTLIFKDVIIKIEKKLNFNISYLWNIFEKNPNYVSKMPQKSIHAMTIHGSKGLEADYIFIERETIEDFISDGWNSEFENMYVALSRLKKNIIIFDKKEHDIYACIKTHQLCQLLNQNITSI